MYGSIMSYMYWNTCGSSRLMSSFSSWPSASPISYELPHACATRSRGAPSSSAPAKNSLPFVTVFTSSGSSLHAAVVLAVPPHTSDATATDTAHASATAHSACILVIDNRGV